MLGSEWAHELCVDDIDRGCIRSYRSLLISLLRACSCSRWLRPLVLLLLLTTRPAVWRAAIECPFGTAVSAVACLDFAVQKRKISSRTFLLVACLSLFSRPPAPIYACAQVLGEPSGCGSVRPAKAWRFEASAATTKGIGLTIELDVLLCLTALLMAHAHRRNLQALPLVPTRLPAALLVHSPAQRRTTRNRNCRVFRVSANVRVAPPKQLRTDCISRSIRFRRWSVHTTPALQIWLWPPAQWALEC